jgi:hypothetical protein
MLVNINLVSRMGRQTIAYNEICEGLHGARLIESGWKSRLRLVAVELGTINVIKLLGECGYY